MNQNKDFVSNLLSGANVKAGYVTEIAITPIQQITSEAFRRLPEHKRKCRLKHENMDPTSLFNYYTQQSCEYMCLLRNMSDTQPCVPWDVPDISHKEVFCHGRQTFTYNLAVREYNPSQDLNCNCPPDCEKISFSFEAASYPITEKEECREGIIGVEFVDTAYTRRMEDTIVFRHLAMPTYMKRQFYDNLKIELPPLQNKYMKTDIDHQYFRGFENDKLCFELAAENNAFVIMYVKEPTMLQLIKDVRFSFADKLGIFGGTIGVFTGISFITMMEIVYWLVLLLINKVSHKFQEGKSNFVTSKSNNVKVINYSPEDVY